MITKIASMLLFCLFYRLYCFLSKGTDKKNLAGLRSYPDAVQQAVREHSVLSERLGLFDLVTINLLWWCY